ncbi:MAG: YkvA family protein [Proteocatella sp.]
MFFKNKDSVIFYVKHIKNIKNFILSKNISVLEKIKVIFVLIMMGIYLVSPIDIVPDFIPLFGYLEDIVVSYAMLFYVGNEIYKNLNNISKDNTSELEKEKSSKSKDKKIIDVKFSDSPEDDEKK